MSNYPMFTEIINEMRARPEADPVGILEETLSPLLDVCNKINLWIARGETFDFRNEPPWFEEFIRELTRFDVDLTPIWRGSEWANGWEPAEPAPSFEDSQGSQPGRGGGGGLRKDEG